MKRAMLTLWAAVSAIVLSASVASAAATVHFSLPRLCADDGTYTVCSQADGQNNYETTPSGNIHHTGKGTIIYSITVDDGSFTYSDTYDYKLDFLSKDGVAQVTVRKVSDTTLSGGLSCTFTDHYVFANGDIRHSTPSYTCS